MNGERDYGNVHVILNNVMFVGAGEFFL